MTTEFAFKHLSISSSLYCLLKITVIVEKDSLSVVIGVKDSRAKLYSLTSKQTVELSAYCDP